MQLAQTDVGEYRIYAGVMEVRRCFIATVAVEELQTRPGGHPPRRVYFAELHPLHRFASADDALEAALLQGHEAVRIAILDSRFSGELSAAISAKLKSKQVQSRKASGQAHLDAHRLAGPGSKPLPSSE